MRSLALLLVGLYGALIASSQPSSLDQLQYLDEIGHLGPPFDERTSVSFSDVHVSPEADGVLIQGYEDDGRAWNAVLPTEGGVGWTDVWRADFDRTSRPDLLIAAHVPSSGRCIDGITLSFLLFDGCGRPVPWVLRTQMPQGERSSAIPAMFTDVNRDGRAELVVTDCSYSLGPRNGEDRRITGIYQAQDAAWNLIRHALLDPYVALVRRNHRFQPGHDELLPADPSAWSDQGNASDPQADPPLRLAAVLPASADCPAVRLPPLVNGVYEADWEDPCLETGQDRLQLSDGTVCLGWPVVVVDRADGREIVAHGPRLKLVLQEIVDEKRTVVFTGQHDPERCSPSVLRAFQSPPAE